MGKEKPLRGEWPRATICPFSKLHVTITDGCPRLARIRGGREDAQRGAWVNFVRGTVVPQHGPYRRPEGSVAGFNRFAHSAGPGGVPQRGEAVGSGFDGLMQSSKWQVRRTI